MSLATPCSSGERDPEDWFLEPYGKQYREDPMLSEQEIRAAAAPLFADGAAPDEETLRRTIDLAASEKKRQALIRRRKARDACREDCPVRRSCLGYRLENSSMEYGTWGGYYAEELREIERLRREREE